MSTKYITYEAKLSTKEVTVDGIVENVFDHVVGIPNNIGGLQTGRTITLPPSSNITIPLPPAPCVILIKARRHEDDPSDATMLKTDPMIIQLSGVISAFVSDAMFRCESVVTEEGLTVIIPDDAGDYVTVMVHAEGIVDE